jgi:hypothetical protein
MFFIWFIIVSSLLFVLFKIKYAERDKAFASFPAPTKLQFLRNAFDLLGSNMSEQSLLKLAEFHNKLGEVFLFHLHPFHCGIVIVADPIVAKAVSLHQPDRTKSFFYQYTTRFTGFGLFMSSRKDFKKYLITAKLSTFSEAGVARVSCNMSDILFCLYSKSSTFQILTAANSNCDELLDILGASCQTPQDAEKLFDDTVFDMSFGKTFHLY